MQRARIERPVRDQDAHRIDRQARQLDADGRPRRREIAKEHAERMLGADLVVAVGQDEKSLGLGDAPAQEFDEIEGRFVGPMDIFDDKERGLSPAREAARSMAEKTAVRGVSLSSIASSRPPVWRAMS